MKSLYERLTGHVAVQLPEEDERRLIEYCNANLTKKSDVVREALNEKFEKEEVYER